MGLLDGKSELITSAGSGIGRATALTLAAECAQLTVSDVAEDGGRETVGMIREAGGSAPFVRCDVSTPSEIEALVDTVVQAHGRLDYAVNNAGIEGKIAPLAEQPLENWSRIMDVNLRGTFLCLKAEIGAMLKTGGGSIVNLASVAGLIGFPGLAPHVASKHAVNGLTKNAALENGKAGIRVNSVCPGGIDTRMLESLTEQSSGSTVGVHEMMDPLHPIGRIGRPAEVANLIAWLLSDRASFLTGTNVPVDGSYVAQ